MIEMYPKDNGDTSPTPATVAKHLTWVQIVSIIAAMLGVIGTLTPPTALASVPWFAPATAIAGMLAVVLLAGLKAYNVPVIIVMAALALPCLAGLQGCAANETNRVAQSIVATTEQARIAGQLHDAGVLTPASEQRILTFLKASAAAEDAYYAAIQAGDSQAMKAAKASWAAATAAASAELQRYLPAAGAATVPATRPG